ncbi:MAG TPA: hypothetical protein VFL57_05755 [Bryobacteraceae bacterium]|nr:hypothetical protein [Bryobacteraceae bacterium]
MQSGVIRMCCVTAGMALRLCAQSEVDLRAILDRLDRLERQNRDLIEEVRALRSELTAARTAEQPQQAPQATPLPERIAVAERRIEEHAESKVESAQKLPVRLTGMVLFNAFRNGRYSGTDEYPRVAALNAGNRFSGAMVRQSVIGLEFNGGQTIGGGRLSGSLFMDFFAGSQNTLGHTVRIRTASAQIDWARTTLLVGQEKPIFSQRDPTSLAMVGVSPMTGSGNPWLWLPQVRVERRFTFGEETGLRAQIGVLQTNETAANTPAAFASTLARARPALEGRFLFHGGKLEVAPGFHLSTTHVAGISVPANAFSVDWLYAPWPSVRFTGLAYGGANLASLGTLRQGFTILGPRDAIAVRTRGGWAQLELIPAARLSFHLIAGQADDNDRDLRFGGIGKNQTYAANVMYRIGQNFIVAFEGSRVRTTYLRGPVRRNTHYDLAFAYLF